MITRTIGILALTGAGIWYGNSLIASSAFVPVAPVPVPTVLPITVFAPPVPAKPALPKLAAGIHVEGWDFKVTNYDVYTWKNCRIDLNAGVFSHGYSLKVSVISESVSLNLGDFTTATGERFNPLELKVMSVDMDCETERGHQRFWGT